jgi:hypothetical protein
MTNYELSLENKDKVLFLYKKYIFVEVITDENDV